MGQLVQDLDQREIPNLPSGKKITNSFASLLPKSEPKVAHNYASELHNLASAKAVYYKPLKNSNSNGTSNKINDEADNGGGKNKSLNEKIVIDISSDDDDEDEIDMSDSDVTDSENDLKGGEDELKRIIAIRETFESVSTSDLEESFDAVCVCVNISLVSLWEVVLEDSGSNTDNLIKLAYGAISTLNNKFGSMSQKQQEQNKRSLSRLLYNVTCQTPPLFAVKEMKEIESMIKFLETGSSVPSLGYKDKHNIENDDDNKMPVDSRKSEKSSLESRVLSVKINEQNKFENDDKIKIPTDFIYLETSSLEAGVLSKENNKQSEIGNDDETKTIVDFMELETSSLDVGLLQETNKQKKIKNDNEAETLKNFSELETSLECRGLLGETNKQSKIENEDVAKTSNNFIELETNEQRKIESGEETKTYIDFTKLETSKQKGRGPVLPFLDLLKDRDEDSIPSPTLKGPKFMPAGGDPPAAHGAKDVMSYYQTDAFKVVSTYQQKFGQDFNMSDLPSPTPSEGGDNRVGDTDGEVSTSSIVGANFKNVNAPNLPQLCHSSHTVPLKSLSKSRDPRLRFANADTVDSRVSKVNPVGETSSKKKKARDELVPDGPILKRQNSGPTDSGTAAISSGTNSTSSLEYILKEFDVNPAILTNLRKVEEENITNSSLESILKEFNVDPAILTNAMEMGEHKSIADPVENFKRVSSSNSGEIGVTHPKSAKVPSSQPCQGVKPVNNQRGAISSYQEVSAVPSPSQNAYGDVNHLFKGLDDKQKAAFHKERARRIEEQKKMFAARKLSLVLDVDHTLLNSVKFSEVDPVHDGKLRKKEQKHRKNPHRQLFRIPHMGLWTKLRPGVWNFLEKASKLYELHLCTMGNKMYATEMAKLLDPKGTLFCGRIISRGDDDGEPDTSKTKDLEGVLGMESCVVIIDDTVQVWPHNKLNLINVERYIYFPCSRRQFGLSGSSLLEIGRDECLEAGTLASSLAVIRRIHQNFFAHPSLEEADVRNILASEQRKILGGCRILFSRIFPVRETNPRRHPLWQTAEQFGAICTTEIDEQVTHVVANSLGTHKVKWACSTGRFVVHPGWVEASAFLYRRANEQDFALKP